MKLPTEQQALRLLQERLAEAFGLEPKDAKLRSRLAETVWADAVIVIGGYTFVIEWKGSGALPQVSRAVEQARHYASLLGGHAIPLVAVPFMGSAGRALCDEANVGWLDLSGNARLIAPGLRVKVEGQPNRFKGPGRPADVFAPKSSRIARWLLMHPNRAWTQRELATATKMGEGFTSRIVAKLEEDDLLVRDPEGRLRARDPDLLLDAWAESYSFSKHNVLRGHISTRSGEAQVRKIADILTRSHRPYAATGLAAAWFLDHFAGFRIATIFLAEAPEPPLLEELGFREAELGANTWLVVPNDEGVFQGADGHEGVRCVHPVQAYVDLLGHPERAKDAARQLRRDLLNWAANV